MKTKQQKKKTFASQISQIVPRLKTTYARRFWDNVETAKAAVEYDLSDNLQSGDIPTVWNFYHSPWNYKAVRIVSRFCNNPFQPLHTEVDAALKANMGDNVEMAVVVWFLYHHAVVTNVDVLQECAVIAKRVTSMTMRLLEVRVLKLCVEKTASNIYRDTDATKRIRQLALESALVQLALEFAEKIAKALQALQARAQALKNEVSSNGAREVHEAQRAQDLQAEQERQTRAEQRELEMEEVD